MDITREKEIIVELTSEKGAYGHGKRSALRPIICIGWSNIATSRNNPKGKAIRNKSAKFIEIIGASIHFFIGYVDRGQNEYFVHHLIN